MTWTFKTSTGHIYHTAQMGTNQAEGAEAVIIVHDDRLSRGVDPAGAQGVIFSRTQVKNLPGTSILLVAKISKHGAQPEQCGSGQETFHRSVEKSAARKLIIFGRHGIHGSNVIPAGQVIAHRRYPSPDYI